MYSHRTYVSRERENEKHERGEGGRRGAGGQWRRSEGVGRPVGGFGCSSAVVEVRGRGGHHRLGRSVMGSVVWTV